MLILGDKDIENNTVSIRKRHEGDPEPNPWKKPSPSSRNFSNDLTTQNIEASRFYLDASMKFSTTVIPERCPRLSV